MTAEHNDRIYIEGRLPNKPFVSVPDVATAFSVSNHTVVSYIESGRLTDVRNVGSCSKRFFKIGREDAVRLWLSMRFKG